MPEEVKKGDSGYGAVLFLSSTLGTYDDSV